MQSAIGQRFKSPRAQRVAAALGIVTIAADAVFVTHSPYEQSNRLALALAAFAILVGLTGGDLSSIGLRATPKQGWRPWIRTSIIIALIVAVCIVVGLGAWRLTGHEIPIFSVSPAQIVPRFLHSCFVYPVMEETIYRVVVCVSLAGALGCRPTIAASGLLFGALHVAYGNPSPENLVGGFFLAWAYMKSESVLLPVLLHSIGNAIVLASHVVAWYVLNTRG